MDDRSTDEKRRRLLLVAVLVILGLGSGVAVRVWMKPSPDAGGAAGDPAAAFRSDMSPKAAAAWKRLLSTLATRTGRTLSVARVKNLLIDGHQEDPLAVAFANDFKRSPRLMAIWNQYADSHDTLNADWLVEQLSDSSEFADLVSKYADKPQFDLLALQVNLETGFVIGQDALLPGASAEVSTEAARPSMRLAREPPLPSARGAKLRLIAVQKTGPVQGYGAVAQTAGQTGQQQPGSLTGITGGPATLGGPVAPGEGPVADRQGPPTPASKPGGHNAAKLKTIQAAGPSMDATQFLSSVYENLAKENRQKLMAVCQTREVCDPVDACRTANIYAACLDACNASPKCKGKIPDLPPGESEDTPPTEDEPAPAPAAVVNTVPSPSPTPAPSPSPSPSPTPTPSCQPNTPPCCPNGTNTHPHCHGATQDSCHNHAHCTHVGHH